MRQYSSPALVSIDGAATLTDVVLEHGTASPDAVLFRRRPIGSVDAATTPPPDQPADAGTAWMPVTAREFLGQVDALARGLLSSGLQPGERVAIVSRTRYEWTLLDYALWHAGLVSVPIYETSAAEQVAWILGDSQAVAVVVEGAGHAATVAALRDQLPDLTHVWGIEAGDLDMLAERGRADATSVDALAHARRGLAATSLATLIYTSGTTGRPKGCRLTHGNLLFGPASAIASLPALFTADTSALLFLPLAHVLAREIQIACVMRKVPIGHCPDTHALQDDLASFEPTLLLAVPYVFEKLYTVARQRAATQGKVRVFDRAAAVAIRASQARDRGGASLGLRVQQRVFDRLVYAKLRAALGGEVAWVVSGGAPLGTRLGHFFRGAGTPVLEGWGLTETTACATVNRPDAVRIGTVGRPLAGTTVAIADDGELLVRGDHVFEGYWGEPPASETALDEQRWLHTGDLGEIDDDGFVTITGRKKEILITAGGKNVSPAVLEDRLRGHPLIAQCMVVGDRRAYIGCLVTLDPEALAAWASKVGREPAGDAPLDAASLRDDPQLRAELQLAIDDANRAVSRAESIRRFAILPVDFTEAGGQLTPTLKLRRDVVAAQFAADIEELYAGREPAAPPR